MATTVDEILVRFLGDTSDFDRARTRFARGLQQIGKAGTLAGAAVTAGFGAIVTASVNASASLEQTTIAYDVLVGNVAKSRQLLKDMEQFAKISPFDVGEVEMAGKRLMAMGFAAKEIIPTLKDVGDVTAGIGIGGGRFERIIHNLAQVRTQGKLTARELRDFAVNGVPLLDSLATSIKGLSPNLMEARAQIHDMIRRGQISDMQVLRAFRKMASAGGKFADLMFKQSKTFLGMLSNIRDSLLITAREIGQVFMPPLKVLASKTLELLDIFRSMDPVVKKIAAYLAVFGMAGGAALGTLAMGAIALGAAMLFLGPAIAVIKSVGIALLTFNPIVGIALTLTAPLIIGIKALGVAFVSLLVPLKKVGIAFATIALLWRSFRMGILRVWIVLPSLTTMIKGLAFALFALVKTPLKTLLILPFALLAPVVAALVHPISLLVIGLTALTAMAFKAKDSFGGWAELFNSAKSSALSFAKGVVGFVWNIRENSKIIIEWLRKNWSKTFIDIAMFLVNSIKLSAPVLIQNFLVVTKHLLKIVSILYHNISKMAISTWEYIWSASFIDAGRRALIKFTVKHMIPFFIALRRAWDTWKFSPLDEWAKGATGKGGTFEQIKREFEQMLKDMQSIKLAELDLTGPELNLNLDGLFKDIEDWKPNMGNLFEESIEGANELNQALFKLQHYFGKKQFHISQQGLDFGIPKSNLTPGVLNPEVDTAEYIGGGGIPLTGTGDPMMGAFAGVPSMSDILAMPDLHDPLTDFDSYGTGAMIMEPNTELENLIDDTMGAAQEGATTVLNTVDGAVSTAKDWFDTTMDWVGQTMTESENHAPMTPVERGYGTGVANYVTGSSVQQMIQDTEMEMFQSGNYSQNDMDLTFGGQAWTADGMHLDGRVGAINAPFPSGPLQGMTQSVNSQDYGDFIPQYIFDQAYDKFAGASPSGDPTLIDTKHELALLDEALGIRIRKYMEIYKDEFLKYIAPPPGTNAYIDEQFHGIVPGDVGPDPQYYNPSLMPSTLSSPNLNPTHYSNHIFGMQPGTIGGEAPNTFGGVPETMGQFLGLSPVVPSLNPTDTAVNSQSENVNTPGVLDRLDTLIDVTETNGPSAPNQVEDLGIQ